MNSTGDAAGDQGARPPADGNDSAPGDGYYFYGVVRVGAGWEVLRRRPDSEREVVRLRHRDLEAVVRRAPLEPPAPELEAVRAHQRVIDHTMRQGTILPAPFGVIFRSRDRILQFLEHQYGPLDEGLSLVDGHWEHRLHVLSNAPGKPKERHAELASEAYSHLRRYTRSAITFPPKGSRIFSAAFLVEKDKWVEFFERVEELSSGYPELELDLTGPWPPYDFVRMTL